jgi:hypothetical protein
MSDENIEKIIKFMDERDEKNNNTIRIPIDEYMKLQRSYDEYQTKQYIIDLTIHHKTIIEEDGVVTELSNIKTNESYFPDDTHTNLTELYKEMDNNSTYITYLENKCNKLKNQLSTAIMENNKLSEPKKRKLI